MAVHLYTDDPQALLEDFRCRIEDGMIQSWFLNRYRHIIHKNERLGKASLKARPERNRLSLYITIPSQAKDIDFLYAFYHGTLVQTVLKHFPDSVTLVTASPEPERHDRKGRRVR